jgi:hypothetical protein
MSDQVHDEHTGMFSGGRTGHDRNEGLYGKFTVKRTDGTDAIGGKHENCTYFVLDLTHDPHARPAVLTYADACEGQFPKLAADLRKLAGP